MTLNIVDIPEQRQVSGLSFPLTIQASIEQSGLTQTDFHSWVRDHKDHIHEQLIKHGAVLLRGFPVESAEAFEQLLDQTDYQNMPYIGGAAPRDQVRASRIVTANEAPASEKIPFHHEMAQVPTPPGYIFFYCDTAPSAGGSTSILHSAEACEAFFSINPEFASKVKDLGVQYTRVMPLETDTASPIGRSWRETFKAETKAEAEAAMSDAGMSWEWLPDNSVRTTTAILPAIRFDEETDREVFFNSLVAVYTGWDDDRNVAKKAVITSDGAVLDEDVMQAMIAKMDELAVNFVWQPGDVLLINNHTVLHARQPFEGDRRILAAIAYK
jgi:alpha-ketoglutarate-dependent taurine dioxygenase